ncbi:MAG TPA: alpha-1,2-fucosyltransferase [Limnobacter sp.]|uniref:alpha-1,2-fucosyltransferase n=1 Tax=Limnobacter sp. TaxID=2003368 RepID=UPI002EDA9BBD
MHSASSKPLVVRIAGGLGNQMFQYAAALALAQRTGQALQIDARAFQRYTLHSYGLNAWSLSAAVLATSHNTAPSLWRIELAERVSVFRPTTYYKEASLAYQPDLETRRGVQYLSGYFQSERYFQAIRPLLLQEFTLALPLTQQGQALMTELRSVPSVALHVRRGDYVSNPETLRIHGVCSANYYQQAIDRVMAEVPDARFFVFSNDFAWVRQKLRLPQSTVQVDGVAQHPAHDIALMAACQHHIIANSSFSWWGAWLSQSSQGIQIAPQPWYNDPTYAEADLVPSRWRRLTK